MAKGMFGTILELLFEPIEPMEKIIGKIEQDCVAVFLQRVKNDGLVIQEFDNQWEELRMEAVK